MFDVRPGITGWAQVHGRKTVEWNKRIEMNCWYSPGFEVVQHIQPEFAAFVLPNPDTNVWVFPQLLDLLPGQWVRMCLLAHLYPCLSVLFMDTSYHTNLSRRSVQH